MESFLHANLRRRLAPAAWILGMAALGGAMSGICSNASPSSTPEDRTAHFAKLAGCGIGPPGGEIRSLAMAGREPKTLYAGTVNGHIFVSRDAAAGWRATGAPLPETAVVDNLAIDPLDPSIVYAAYWEPSGGGGIIRTLDGGGTWKLLPVPGAPSLRALALAPSAPEIVFAGGVQGLWRSADRGETWVNVSGSREALREVESIAVDPGRPDRVYVGTWRQAYKSVDGCRTWLPIGDGMDIDRDVFTILVSPHDPKVLFAGTCGFLYTSRDAGGVWQSRKQGIPANHRRIHAIVTHPARRNEFYAGTRGGLYRSLDGARSWQALLTGVSVSALALDTTTGRMYVATEERGVLVSRDGVSFTESNAGLNVSRIEAFDAVFRDAGTLVAARTEGEGRQTVLISTDAGGTWSPAHKGFVFPKIRFLRVQTGSSARLTVVTADGRWWRINPGRPPEQVWAPPGRLHSLETLCDRGGLVMAATQAGLYAALPPDLGEARGKGNGSTPRRWRWSPLARLPVSALATQGDRFLAVGPDLVVRGRLSAVQTGDAAGIGTGRPAGLPAGIVGVCLDSGDDAVAYAIARRQVFVSTDSGATWNAAALPWTPTDLTAIAADPRCPGQIFVLDARGILYRGCDRGRHWLLLKQDPELRQGRGLRVSDGETGFALVSTVGQGVRVVSLDPGSGGRCALGGDPGSSPAGPVERTLPRVTIRER